MSSFWAALPSLVAWGLHTAVCATLVTASGAGCLWLVRRRSAPFRHALALAVVGLSLAIPAITAIYQWRLIPRWWPTRLTVAPMADTARYDAAAMPTKPRADREDPASPAARSVNLVFWLGALFIVTWALGSCAKFSMLTIRLLRQRRLLGVLDDVTDAAVLRLSTNLSARLGIRRRLRVVSSAHVLWPFTFGIWRPCVVLPSSLMVGDVNKRQLRAVLIHELAHVARFDYAAVLVIAAAEAAYWWNPFLAFARREMSQAREEICDSYVLNHAGDGISLAEYLLRSAQQANRAQLRFAVGLSLHDPVSLRQRITQLLAGDRNTMIRIGSLSVVAMILSALVVTFFFTHANYANASLVAGMPVNLGPVVNSPAWPDGDPEISADGLTLYYSISRDAGPRHIAVSQRNSPNAPWSAPTIVPELNGTGTNPWFRTSPTVTDDQLLMFFYASPTGTTTNWDIYQSSRASVSAPWEEPVTVGAPINSPFNDQIPGISGDGLTLYFASNRHGPNGNNNGEDLDIYMAQRTSRSEPFGAPIRLGNEINSGNNEGGPDVSSDGLLLVFHSTRDSQAHIFYSERASTSDTWSPAKRLTIGDDTLVSRGNPSLSADKAQLYFTGRTGDGNINTADLYVVDIVPEPSTAALFLAACVVCAVSVFSVRKKRHV